MKYFCYLGSLQGRIGRLHFWLLLLAGAALVFLAVTLGSLNLGNEPVQWLAYALLLASCAPVASATFRRLHDIGVGSRQTVVFFVAATILQAAAFLLSKWSPAIAIGATGLSVAMFLALGMIKGTQGPNDYGS